MLDFFHRSLERAVPGTTSTATLEAVRKINEPVACLVPDLVPAGGIPYEGTKWSKRGRNEEPFNFEPMDTMPYWFSPMASVFGLHRCHVCDAAKRWVVGEWHITDDLCREDYKSFHQEYGWQKISHYQSSYPAVMTLRAYVEHHSLHLVTGEFIDTKPVHTGSSWYRSWKDWSQYHLNPADPSLTSQLLDGPPIKPDHFGVFDDEFDTWAAKSQESDFRNELVLEGNHGDCLVVHASRSGSFHVEGRHFSTDVCSALVEPETSLASARAIECQIERGRIQLPFFDLGYDLMLSSVQEDMVDGQISEWPHHEDTPPNDKQGLFRLEPFCVHWRSERLLHDFDPKWPSGERALALPGRDFITRMQLSRVPLRLRYTDPSGQVTAWCEVWHDYAGTDPERADHTEGRRLIVHREALRQYLIQTDSWLIFTVRISRQRPYRWREEYRTEYDPGTVRAYVFTHEGELLGC